MNSIRWQLDSRLNHVYSKSFINLRGKTTRLIAEQSNLFLSSRENAKWPYNRQVKTIHLMVKTITVPGRGYKIEWKFNYVTRIGRYYWEEGG